MKHERQGKCGVEEGLLPDLTKYTFPFSDIRIHPYYPHWTIRSRSYILLLFFMCQDVLLDAFLIDSSDETAPAKFRGYVPFGNDWHIEKPMLCFDDIDLGNFV